MSYQKFIFQNLPGSSVVNKESTHSVSPQEELINSAIVNHFSKITASDDSKDLDDSDDESLRTSSHLNSLTIRGISDEEISRLKEEYYAKGLQEAKLQYEPLISELQENRVFADLLHQKLEAINPDVDSGTSQLMINLIGNIARKMYLVLPVDFEQLFQEQIRAIVQKFCNSGSIKFFVHPSKYQLCMKLLEAETFDNKCNFLIVQNEECNANDCKIEVNNTKFEYNNSQLSQEIDTILGQLSN